MPKQVWAAPERNKAPILDVLRRVLPARGTLLEIASGTGQHAAHFAEHLPGLVVQPSDVDPQNIESVRAWVQETKLENLRPPMKLDVLGASWGLERVEAIFCANMIHIAPYACTEGLIAGVGRHLADAGVFVLYGPFRVGGAHTAPSNADFDADLKQRDARFGVRDVEAVAALAERHGLGLEEQVAMPANNLCLIFRRVNPATVAPGS